MQAIFNQMAGPYMADRARLQAVIGRSPTSVPPPDDSGRGARPLSAAEQIAFATIAALRDELNASLTLVQDAIAQVLPIFAPILRYGPMPM